MFKPILFSTPMVQAILVGKKTQTRRVIKPQPEWTEQDTKYRSIHSGWWWKDNIKGIEDKSLFAKIMADTWGRYQPGDILWVRETWLDIGDGDCEYCRAGLPALGGQCTCTPEYIYRADGHIDTLWKPSIFMPRAATRLFLQVTNVCVEQLQEISEADLYAEGIYRVSTFGELKSTYTHLWDSLNAKHGFGWDSNPWVWVYKFERVEKPEGFDNV